MTPLYLLALALLALQQAQVTVSAQSLLLAIPASVILSGGVLLVGFYFVHRRFVAVEFPSYVDRVERRLESLVSGTKQVEESIIKLTVLLEKHESRLDFHDWRISRVEQGREPPAPGETRG